MQVLKLIHRCLIILGLCSEPGQSSSYGYTMNWIIVSLLTGFLMITVDYILTHFDDHANALYAIMQFVTFVTVWTCYICFANQKTKTAHFFEELQETVDDYREYQKSLSAYRILIPSL